LTEFCTVASLARLERRCPMPVSPKDVVALTKARARLTELCEEVSRGPVEKLITRNGESCAALIRFVEKWNRGEIPHSPDWEKDWLKGGSR